MSRIYLGIIFNPVGETWTKRKRERERKMQRLGAGRAGAKLTTGGAICSFYPGVAFLVSDAGQAGREWKLLT